MRTRLLLSGQRKTAGKEGTTDWGEWAVNVVADSVRAPVATSRVGLKRGRTWMLAGGDLLALSLAYAATFVVAGAVGPLPPVSAPG